MILKEVQNRFQIAVYGNMILCLLVVVRIFLIYQKKFYNFLKNLLSKIHALNLNNDFAEKTSKER